MINAVGIVWQGPNDLGFLQALKTRLGCEAHFVYERTRGKTRQSKRRDWAKNCRYFSHRGVDLIVRLTDADSDRWQAIKREELGRVPAEFREMTICGVTNGGIEYWMGASPTFTRNQLEIGPGSLTAASLKQDVQEAIARKKRSHESWSGAVSRLVIEADRRCIREWARERSFDSFYRECVAAARRHDCPVNVEYGRPGSQTQEISGNE